MLQVAICDDDTGELEQVRALVQAWLRQHPELDGSLRAFQSGYDLLDCIRERGGFHLYLLDVLMPEQSGIDVGRGIRETDSSAAIIYLTSSPDYAVQSYGVQAFHYLMKPVSGEQLCPVLDQFAQLHLRQQANLLPVRTHDGIVPVQMDELITVEYRQRMVHCRLAGGRTVISQVLRGSFDQFIEPLLGHSQFRAVGASFAVNLSYVEEMTSREFRMKDGSRVPIPRAIRTETQEAYMTYLFERGRG